MPIAVLAVIGAVAASAMITQRGTERLRQGTEAPIQVRNVDGRAGTSYVPPPREPTRPLPLLVALHGTDGEGRSMVRAFRELADEYGFAIVAPDSGKAPNGQWSWAVADRQGEVSVDYRHVMDCVAELRALPNLRIDTARVLIAGHSGGASSAPYIASNEELFTAFAVLHGGVFRGGIGTHIVRGWFSTGRADMLRPPDGVRGAADSMRSAGFRDLELHLYEGGHELSIEERRALVAWWLRVQP